MIPTLKKYCTVLIVTILLPLLAWAQEPSLIATTNTATVQTGQTFQITYTLYNGSNQGFVAPAFNNFNVIGRTQSSGGGMTVIVNGKVVQSGNNEAKWIFHLTANKEGKYTIPPAKAKVNGKWYESNAVDIQVTAGQAQTPQQRGQGQSNVEPDANSKDIFVRAFVNKNNPVQGEQVIVTYKIYTRLPVSQYAINKLPSYTGFWSEDLMKDVQQPKQYEEVIDGQKYVVAEIRKVALFPQKSGKLTVEPLVVDAIVKVKTKSRMNDQFFDDFFNDPFFKNPFFDSYQNVKKALKSNAVNINVASLPSAGKTGSFRGSVGSYSLKANLNKKTLPANDAANLKITISGKGNLRLIEEPEANFPPDLEVYDPKINDNIAVSGSGISGSKVFDYLIIPRNPGDFTIKPILFSFFDPAKKQYVTLQTPEFALNVTKAEGQTGISMSGVNKEDIRFIGSDIRHIETHPFTLLLTGKMFFGSSLFFVLLALPIILFFAFLLLWNRYIKRRSNVVLMRNRHATATARKRLKKAYDFLKNGKDSEFFEEISRAIWGYIGDKLGIQVADLSIESVKEMLAQKNISGEIAGEFISTLDQCEYARFAPGDKTGLMNEVYDKGIAVITRMESELRRS